MCLLVSWQVAQPPRCGNGVQTLFLKLLKSLPFPLVPMIRSLNASLVAAIPDMKHAYFILNNVWAVSRSFSAMFGQKPLEYRADWHADPAWQRQRLSGAAINFGSGLTVPVLTRI